MDAESGENKTELIQNWSYFTQLISDEFLNGRMVEVFVSYSHLNPLHLDSPVVGGSVYNNLQWDEMYECFREMKGLGVGGSIKQ